MRILALDTSSESCSVALRWDGQEIARHQHAPRQHASLILPMVQDVLAEAGLKVRDLDALAYGRGPGSFTGLRIAAGVVQGLALGAERPVIGVSSLSGLALQAWQSNGGSTQCVLVDARMDEVYWSVCRVEQSVERLQVQSLSGEHVSAPERVELPAELGEGALAACGSGLAYISRLPEAVRSRLAPQLMPLEPDARALCRLAEAEYAAGHLLTPEQALPCYIRDEVTWQKLPGR